MRESAITNRAAEIIPILSVSPYAEDHGALENILRHDSNSTGKWKLVTAPTLQRATTMLRINQIPIALCERDLDHGSWNELLDRAAIMPHSPLLIVTSRWADERLWAEALNLGAYDVLAKPFDATEVVHIVSLAWQHWQNRQDLHWRPNQTKEGCNWYHRIQASRDNAWKQLS